MRIHKFGGPDVIVYEDAPDAVAGTGDAVIRVHAASVNQADWQIREGQFGADTPHTLPLILGWDVAGVVEKVLPLAEARQAHALIQSHNVRGKIVPQVVD